MAQIEADIREREAHQVWWEADQTLRAHRGTIGLQPVDRSAPPVVFEAVEWITAEQRLVAAERRLYDAWLAARKANPRHLLVGEER